MQQGDDDDERFGFQLRRAPRVAAPRFTAAPRSVVDDPNLVWNSSYLITINTNKSVQTPEQNERFFERYGEQVIEALNLVFDRSYWQRKGKAAEWKSMFREGGKGALTTRDNNDLPPFKGRLMNIELKLFPEVGARLHRVHFHGIISIDHTLALRLDYAVLRNLLKEAYTDLFPRSDVNVPNLYVNVRFIHTVELAAMYAQKDQETANMKRIGHIQGPEDVHSIESSENDFLFG